MIATILDGFGAACAGLLARIGGVCIDQGVRNPELVLAWVAVFVATSVFYAHQEG